MMFWWHSFLIALQFLTKVPVVKQIDCTESELGHSILFYPVVGLVIGIVLVITYAILPTHASGLLAALILVLWVVITGALHLDGLADSADAWVATDKTPERTLENLQDSNFGLAAVVAVTLVLITKFACLNVILGAIPGWTALLAIPMLARTVIIGLFLKTPYLQQDDIGPHHSEHLPQQFALIAIASSLVLAVLLLGANALAVISIIIITAVLLRAWMMARLGGTTSHTTGALIELTETCGLIAMALVVA